jgi:hypothetical protein
MRILLYHLNLACKAILFDGTEVYSLAFYLARVLTRSITTTLSHNIFKTMHLVLKSLGCQLC